MIWVKQMCNIYKLDIKRKLKIMFHSPVGSRLNSSSYETTSSKNSHTTTKTTSQSRSSIVSERFVLRRTLPRSDWAQWVLRLRDCVNGSTLCMNMPQSVASYAPRWCNYGWLKMNWPRWGNDSVRMHTFYIYQYGRVFSYIHPISQENSRFCHIWFFYWFTVFGLRLEYLGGIFYYAPPLVFQKFTEVYTFCLAVFQAELQLDYN